MIRNTEEKRKTFGKRIDIVSFTAAGLCLSKKMKRVLESQAEVFCYSKWAEGKKNTAVKSDPAKSVFIDAEPSGTNTSDVSAEDSPKKANALGKLSISEPESAKADASDPDSEVLPLERSITDWCGAVFAQTDAIVFIGACGIAVRAIAPFLKGKQYDPAVLVSDETGKYVISLLSGHLGGGNALARFLAEKIGAAPVITTASDVNGKLAVDVWAKENNWKISDFKLAKYAAAEIVDGTVLPFYAEEDAYETEQMQCGAEASVQSERMRCDKGRNPKLSLPFCLNAAADGVSPELDFDSDSAGGVSAELDFDSDLAGDVSAELDLVSDSAGGVNPESHCDSHLVGSVPSELQSYDKKEDFLTACRARSDARISGIAVSIRTDWPDHVLRLVPRQVILGIGCRRGKPYEEIRDEITALLEEYHVARESIAVIASIDLKAEEAGICTLAEQWEIPFVTFGAEELMQVPGEFEGSDFVKKTTGADNVCERAAAAAVPGGAKYRWICRKVRRNGVTAALMQRFFKKQDSGKEQKH